MVIVNFSPSEIKRMKEHAYHFMQMSEDGFCCLSLEKPMPLTLSLEHQTQHILNFAKISECNISMAKIYGCSNREKMIGTSLEALSGKSLDESRFLIHAFLKNNYTLQNYESELRIDKSAIKYLLCNFYGEVESGHLLSIWGSQKDITQIKSSQIKLEKMLFLEKLLGRISKSFLSATPDSIDAIINSCLKDLGEVKHIDRSYVFLLSKYGNKISNSHEWCREGISKHKDDLQGLNFEKSMPSTKNALSKDNIFQASLKKDHSKLTKDEIQMMEVQSIQSFLLVGLKNENKLMGFVGFDAVRLAYEWTIEDISLLQLFADLLSFALLNVNFQKELIEKDKSLLEFYDRMNDDLEIAKETQKNLVSLDFPTSTYYQLTSYFRPFEKVGGDIISYHLHTDYIDLMFGDVSGHGISSAMVSGMVILSFRNSSRLNESPAQILLSMNRDLKTIVLNHHITAACARYYFKERKLVYSYAGHPPLVLINQDNFEELPGMNTPLLTLENIEYFEKDLILAPGSRLVFYSDGCYEIFNRDKQLLGLYPFFEILKKESHSKDAARFIQNSILKILNFCSGDIKDDLTMLVLDVN